MVDVAQSTLQKVALIGANGMLAKAIKNHAPNNFLLQCFDLPDFDLTDPGHVMTLKTVAPDIIINCAAYTNVDRCEDNPELAMQVNGEGPGRLAELAKMTSAVLLHVSTDFFLMATKKLLTWRWMNQSRYRFMEKASGLEK